MRPTSTAIGVRGLSLDIAAGEFVTFLGPSGSGKTTTLSMVAGFVTPSAGRIEVDGRDITHAAPEKRNIGMVFQDYSLFPHMTVEENVGFPLRMRGVATWIFSGCKSMAVIARLCVLMSGPCVPVTRC